MFMPPLRGNFSRVLDVDPTAGTYRAGRYAGASVEETTNALFTFTRATTAAEGDQYGALSSAASGVLRNGYDPSRVEWRPERATNTIPNPSGHTGSVVGTVGAGGTLPTGWSIFSAGGLTTSIVSKGFDGAQPYLDYRISGTSTGTFYVVVLQNPVVAGTAGLSYTFSMIASLIAGSMTGVTMGLDLRWGGGATTAGTKDALTSTPRRMSVSGTMPVANTGTWPGISFAFTNGASIDLTLRLFLPILEQTAEPTNISPWRLERATNSLPNQYGIYTTPPTFPTAAAPTSWSGVANASVAITIVGQGIESGIAYTDVRFAGTPSSTTFSTLVFDSGTQIPAVQGQNVTLSLAHKLVAGSLTNVVANSLFIGEQNSSGTQVVSGGYNRAPTAAWQRVEATRPLVNAATAYVRTGYRVSFTSGLAVDLTVRIGLLLCEVGASAATDITPLTHGWLIEGAATNVLLNSAGGISTGGAAGNTNVVSTDVPELFSGATIRKHTRSSDTVTNTDDNCGNIPIVYTSLTAAQSATWSAYVYIPSGQTFTNNLYLRIEGGGGGVQGQTNFDTTKRDQWQRITGTFTVPAWTSNPTLILRLGLANASAVVYTTAPQLEQQSFATSYIQSSGSAATRNNDLLSMTGTNFSNVFGEASRTNLVLRSGEFDNNATWIRSQLSGVAANALTDPFGGTTAETLTDDTSNSPHGVQQVVALTAGQQYTCSVYAKVGTVSFLRITINDQLGSTASSYFNLTGGTATGVVNTGAFSGTTQAITSIGSGWYRCSVTVISPSTTATGVVGMRMEKVNLATAYLGDGTGTIHVFGAQMETGSTATPYIPTTTTTVTSTASTQGTLIFDAMFPQAAGATPAYIGQVDDGSDGNRIFLWVPASGSTLTVNSQIAAVLLGSGTPAPHSYTAGTPFRVGMRWAPLQLSHCVNGQAVQSIVQSVPPGLSAMRLGQSVTQNRPMNGRIRRVQAFKHAMSDAEFQARCTLGAG